MLEGMLEVLFMGFFSFHLPGFIQGRVMYAKVCVFLHQVCLGALHPAKYIK